MVARGEAQKVIPFSPDLSSTQNLMWLLLMSNPVMRTTMVTPQITGRGWVHGIHQIGVDPDDPYQTGLP